VPDVHWFELFPQCDFRNRDSRYETWGRHCQEYGFL
jgi:hypothetical protein